MTVTDLPELGSLSRLIRCTHLRELGEKHGFGDLGDPQTKAGSQLLNAAVLASIGDSGAWRCAPEALPDGIDSAVLLTCMSRGRVSASLQLKAGPLEVWHHQYQHEEGVITRLFPHVEIPFNTPSRADHRLIAQAIDMAVTDDRLRRAIGQKDDLEGGIDDLHSAFRQMLSNLRMAHLEQQMRTPGCLVAPEDSYTLPERLAEESRRPDLSTRLLWAAQALETGGNLAENIFLRAAQRLDKLRPEFLGQPHGDVNDARSFCEDIAGGASVIASLSDFHDLPPRAVRALAGVAEVAHFDPLSRKVYTSLRNLPAEHLPKTRAEMIAAEHLDHAGIDLESIRGAWLPAMSRHTQIGNFSDVAGWLDVMVRDTLHREYGEKRGEALSVLLAHMLTPDRLSEREKMTDAWHKNSARLSAEMHQARDAGLGITWEPRVGERMINGTRMREITSARELVELGLDQEHCVGLYIDDVLAGESIIVTHEREGRITATSEITPTFDHRQCRGRKNAKVSLEDMQAINDFCVLCEDSFEDVQLYHARLKEPAQKWAEVCRMPLPEDAARRIFEAHMIPCLPGRMGLNSFDEVKAHIIEAAEKQIEIERDKRRLARQSAQVEPDMSPEP